MNGHWHDEGNKPKVAAWAVRAGADKVVSNPEYVGILYNFINSGLEPLNCNFNIINDL